MAQLGINGLRVTAAGLHEKARRRDALMDHMRHDKKVLDGRLRLILARGIGKAFITSVIDEADIADVFDAFLSEA